MCAHVAARDVARAPSALSLTLYVSLRYFSGSRMGFYLDDGTMAGTPAGRWRSALAHVSFVAHCARWIGKFRGTHHGLDQVKHSLL